MGDVPGKNVPEPLSMHTDSLPLQRSGHQRPRNRLDAGDTAVQELGRCQWNKAARALPRQAAEGVTASSVI